MDHSDEGGLRLGLWTKKEGSVSTPDRKTRMHAVFQAAGTDHEAEAMAFALELVGKASWKEFLADHRMPPTPVTDKR